MADTAMAVVFLGLQVCLWLVWCCWTRSRASGLSTAELILCSALLYFAHIIGVSLILGWLGMLARGPLLVLVLLSAGGVLLLALLSPTRLRTLATMPVGLPLGTGTARILNCALLILLGVVLAFTLLQGAVSGLSTWDDRKYHLPTSVLMLQEGRLALGPVHNPVIAGYPKDIAIWYHWMLSFFRDDRWVDLGQVPFLLLGMVATYCAACRLGARPPASLSGALLFPFAPVVLRQITTAYTDVALSALVLSAVALWLIVRDGGSTVVVLAFGCALGLLAGTKFSGAAHAGLFLALFGVTVMRADRGKGLRALALAALLLAFLGSDTYIRNWWAHGNPVFPFRVAHRSIPFELPGVMEPGSVHGAWQTKGMNPVVRLARSWGAVDVVTHSTIFGGFGVAWPFLCAVSAVSLGISVRSRDRARLAVFALFLALFLTTPLNFRVRFVIYLLGLGGISLSHLLDRVAWPAPARLLLAAAVMSVAAFSTYQIWRAEYASLLSDDPVARAERADSCATAQSAYFREAYRWVRSHAGPGSTVVVFRSDDEFFPYCVWNKAFSNRVEFGRAGSRAELVEVAARRPNTLLFLPHGSAEYRYYASDPTPFRETFFSEDLTIATLKGKP